MALAGRSDANRLPAGTDLERAVAELYLDYPAEPPLSAVLEQLMRHSRHCVGASAGSVSLVDPCADRYAKIAEYGASCRLGQSFPLSEGVTGQVVARRAPMVLASYREVPIGHLAEGHPASRGGVAAVPIWWLGDVIGVNVVFAGSGPAFTKAQVDRLEMLTQVAAAAIVRAGAEVRRPAGRELIAPIGPSRRWLTPREHEVLGLLALGMTDQEIADQLVISRKTAEKHVGAILRKTGANRRTAAVIRALQRGWVRAEPVQYY